MNLKKLNKKEIGNILTPIKIYKLDYKDKFKKLYEKLYFDNFNYSIMTNLFFLSVLISFIIYLFIYPNIYIFFNNYITSGLIYAFLIIFLSYFILNLFIYYFLILAIFFRNNSKFRAKQIEIEQDLPEFLDNLVSNLKGGISLEKAFLKSVRKEQKALLTEVKLINEKIMMGASAISAIHGFRKRFEESAIISRTFFLVEEGIKGGGNLADPLEKISENLKRIYILNDEIKASAGGFAIVIKGISLVVGPLLFALAITLLTFIGNLFSLLSDSGTEMISVSSVPVEFPKYLIIFSYAMITLITIFSSLITSELKNEQTFEALKYLPIYLSIALILYWQFSNLLLMFFGNII